MSSSNLMTRGIAASLAASVLFAFLAFYSDILARTFGGWEIFGWRLLLTFPALTLAMVATGRWPRVIRFVTTLTHSWWRIPVLLTNASLLAAQMMLFTWAPGAGRAAELSLGYFLMPLVMIVIGRVGFCESITRGQGIATVLALLGVAYEAVRAGSLTWVTLVVAIGYPAYFVCRRLADMASSSALWAEMALMVPLSLAVVGNPTALRHAASGSALALIIGLGILSAGAMAVYTGAQTWLPFALFGLLSYLEPVLLVIVAFTLLGESITAAEMPTYGLIWLAVLVLAAEGAWRVLRRKRRHDLWWPEMS
ncbi:EamA family transporter RarD [Bowdeniella nasicola]|nr:EamA family transporter RarD [Bowdeniella nasicola]